MHRNTPFVQGEMYHIYNRGTEKRSIFLSDTDRDRFQLLLYIANSPNPVHFSNLLYLYQGLPLIEIYKGYDIGERLVDIGAYCLMPNHFHILLRERTENGISKFMLKLSTAYSMYFNKKNERSGALFQGAFKSKHVGDEAYLNWLFSYIHLNPLKIIEPGWKEKGVRNVSGAKDFMKKYAYSSHRDYFEDTRPESKILARGEFPEYFSDINDFESLCEEFGKPPEGD